MTWLPVVVTVAPTSEPVSILEARKQCRYDDGSADIELAIYIQAAREHVEAYTGTKLLAQTVELRASSFCDLESLPSAPIQSITAITYLDSDGVEQTLANTIYEGVLIGLDPSIRLKINQSWPALRPVSDAVKVTAVAGYSAVPAAIKQAMLLTIEAWNESREVGEIPAGAVSLLTNHRKY